MSTIMQIVLPEKYHFIEATPKWVQGKTPRSKLHILRPLLMNQYPICGFQAYDFAAEFSTERVGHFNDKRFCQGCLKKVAQTHRGLR